MTASHSKQADLADSIVTDEVSRPRKRRKIRLDSSTLSNSSILKDIHSQVDCLLGGGQNNIDSLSNFAA